MDGRFNIAVLIDGDNAQPKLLKETLEEVSKYGKATVRRIYGDWTSQYMNGWKESLNKYSISPIQKFTYTTGKNSTDSAMIIDAMDILYAENVDGFCIVSSDSDYTGLAKRIREDGLFVMGIGEKKTPEAFTQSCEVFVYYENLVKETFSSNKKSKTVQPVDTTDEAIPYNIINRAFNISVKNDTEAYISQIGVNLRKIDSSFDPRTYGFKTLTELFRSLDIYQVINNEVNGLNQPLVRLKED